LPGRPRGEHAAPHDADDHARRRDAEAREEHEPLRVSSARGNPDRERADHQAAHDREPRPRSLLGDLGTRTARERCQHPLELVAGQRVRAASCGPDAPREPCDLGLQLGDAWSRRIDVGGRRFPQVAKLLVQRIDPGVCGLEIVTPYALRCDAEAPRCIHRAERLA
jgi:hypothetical protein